MKVCRCRLHNSWMHQGRPPLFHLWAIEAQIQSIPWLCFSDKEHYVLLQLLRLPLSSRSTISSATMIEMSKAFIMYGLIDINKRRHMSTHHIIWLILPMQYTRNVPESTKGTVLISIFYALGWDGQDINASAHCFDLSVHATWVDYFLFISHTCASSVPVAYCAHLACPSSFL